jgi:hypothetical protein
MQPKEITMRLDETFKGPTRAVQGAAYNLRGRSCMERHSRQMKTRLKRVIKRLFLPATHPLPTAVPKKEYEMLYHAFDTHWNAEETEVAAVFMATRLHGQHVHEHRGL